MSKAVAALMTVLALALAVTACGGDDGGGDDLLASIEEKGVLTVSTDPAYPPQSELNKQTGEYEGFDIDVAKEIADRLGVDIAWEAPAWETIISGSWNGRWDISVGSMTITPERAEVLYFSPPYYFTPAAYAVHKDNTTITGVGDLTGKTIGACGGCTYDLYLQNKLNIAKDASGEPVKIESKVTDPEIKTYDTDSTAIQDLALGDGRRLDAVVSALPTLEAAIEAGSPIKIVPSRPRRRAPVGRGRQELAARSHEPRRSNLGDHRGDARRRHDGRALGEVVRHGSHRRSAQGDGVS